MANTTNAIEASNLCKRFGKFSLEDVSFALPPGYIMGFIGPNGAGKTTTIKLMLGLLKRDGGDIRLFGRDCGDGEVKERVGVVMDQPFYADDWRASDVGKALAPFYRRWDADKFRELLHTFAIDERKKIKELSRGMKVKLMMAAALSHGADLLILDEPTSGLDAVARADLMDLLSGFIADEGKAVLYSTHITADLEKTADYIAFIDGGRIRYFGTRDDLMESYCVVKGGLGVLSAEHKKHLIGYREHGVGFDGLAATADLSLMPGSVAAEPCSLDEIVVRFYKEGKHE